MNFELYVCCVQNKFTYYKIMYNVHCTTVKHIISVLCIGYSTSNSNKKMLPESKSRISNKE